MGWNFANDRPIYSQLVEEITQQIIRGVYPPGSRFPAVRELAANAGVNPNTMQRAMTELETRGLLHAERTAGRFVTEDAARLQEERTRLAGLLMDDYFRRMAELGFAPHEASQMIVEKEMKNDAK